MAGFNAGILLLSQLARIWTIAPNSWRWIFKLAAVPALLGVLVLTSLPESPKWMAARGAVTRPAPLRELFRPGLLRMTLFGILLSSIPMIGAWAASKWMIPWADKAAGSLVSYKAVTQGWWALGATLGSVAGAQVANRMGRRTSYFLMSVGSTLLTIAMFQLTAPLQPLFFPIVFVQGFVATLFFGWLTLYLPELFPTHVRATGTGLAYNSGRFATAAGVLVAGALFTALGGNYPKVGALCALIYAFGMIAIWWAPDTTGRTMDG
jgi:MFS family permease